MDHQTLLKQIRENSRIKRVVASEQPFWFSTLYLPHHFTYSLAPFHLEMFHLIQQTECNFLAVMAFRESGKSTILNTMNVLWSILGKPKKKFVLIVSKTQEQAKNHFTNIKSELQNNEALREDFGPFTENEKDWNKLSLELEYCGAKIMSITREQSVRGLKYGQYRPDLIILDDVEDKSDADNPRALQNWFESEIMPLGSTSTRIVILGNLLSEHSFIMRLRKDISEGNMSGIFRAYPLVDDTGLPLWESRFPDAESLKELEKRIPSQTLTREYYLSLREKSVYKSDSIWEEKLKAISQKYHPLLQDTAPQIPLIKPMERYVIHAPLTTTIAKPETDDVRFETYMQYMKECNAVGREYEENLREEIIARIRSKMK